MNYRKKLSDVKKGHQIWTSRGRGHGRSDEEDDGEEEEEILVRPFLPTRKAYKKPRPAGKSDSVERRNDRQILKKPLLYSKFNGLQRTDAAYVLENYFRLIKWTAGDAVLDVGCGAGDVTSNLLLPLLPAGFRKLTGADLSEEMVQFARSRNADDRVDFVAVDIAAKEVPVDLEEEFNHVFSFYCLHWIQDQRQAMQNMFQLLKPGGDILITFLASNPIFQIYERLSKIARWTGYMKNSSRYISPYQNCKNPEKVFEKLLIDVGFAVHLCKVVERKYVYNNLATLQKSVIAISPFIGSIPDDLHAEYLADFTKEVRSLNYIRANDNNNEETINVPYQLFVVMASKPKT